MLRKIIAAAALAASTAVAIAPSAALAQDRGHGGWCVFRKVPDSDSGKSRTVISESPGQ